MVDDWYDRARAEGRGYGRQIRQRGPPPKAYSATGPPPSGRENEGESENEDEDDNEQAERYERQPGRILMPTCGLTPWFRGSPHPSRGGTAAGGMAGEEAATPASRAGPHGPGPGPRRRAGVPPTGEGVAGDVAEEYERRIQDMLMSPYHLIADISTRGPRRRGAGPDRNAGHEPPMPRSRAGSQGPRRHEGNHSHGGMGARREGRRDGRSTRRHEGDHHGDED